VIFLILSFNALAPHNNNIILPLSAIRNTVLQNLKGFDKMDFYNDERIGIFIDGANLHSAARSLGFDIDYKRLLKIFKETGKLIRVFYYTALVEDQKSSPIRSLVDWLDYNGYTLITKPAKEYIDPSGQRKIKGNMDIEISIDAIETCEQMDHIVLFSGDGDFRRLVEALQRRGKRVTIVSTLCTKPPLAADELRRQADNFIELNDLKKKIERLHDEQDDDQPPNPIGI